MILVLAMLFATPTIPPLPTPWSECAPVRGSTSGQVRAHAYEYHWRPAPLPPEIVERVYLEPLGCKPKKKTTPKSSE